MPDELETWVQAHIAKVYPGMTREDRLLIYRSSDILQTAYAALRQAQKDGDPADIKAVARRVYLAWVQVLKAAPEASQMPQEARSIPGAPQTPPQDNVAPGDTESPFRRYYSEDLGAEIALCQTAAEAQRYWETPGGVVAYIPQELTILRAVRDRDPEHAKANVAWLHSQKALFGGQLTSALADHIPKKDVDKSAKIDYHRRP